MKIIRVYILKQFFITFLASMFFFVFILEIGDIFPNISRYFSNDVKLSELLLNMVYYFPKCISFAVPMSLLLSVSYTIGTLYMNNELIAIFGSGISLKNFILPLALFGLVMSGFMFIFNDQIVISSYLKKQEYSNQLLNKHTNLNNSNVAETGDNSIVIIKADHYNNVNTTLTNVTVILYDENHNRRITVDAPAAEWNDSETVWKIRSARVFNWDEFGEFVSEEFHQNYQNKEINIKPGRFRSKAKNMDEMTIVQARDYVEQMKNASLSVKREILVNYYEKFSFAFAPLIVVLIASVMGGRLKKNVLLMSLVLSLGLIVFYYVLQMIAVVFAKDGIISPLIGAWLATIVISGITAFLYKNARS